MSLPQTLPDELLPDPITVVYRAIHSGLLAHKGFTDLVPPARFEDMSASNFVRPNPQIGAGEAPEVLLFQSGFVFRPEGRNSLTSEIEQSFDLVQTSDTKLCVTPVNALKWATFVALKKLDPELGPHEFVRDRTIRDAADDAFGQREWKRDQLKYLTVIRVTVTLSLPRDLVDACFTPQT